MGQEVIFVRANSDDPNTEEINAVCNEMADRGLALASSVMCNGVNEQGLTVTVGLWLFFSDLSTEDRASSRSRGEEEFGRAYPIENPRRWSP